jgi:hypothetical protein
MLWGHELPVLNLVSLLSDGYSDPEQEWIQTSSYVNNMIYLHYTDFLD